MNHTFAPLVVVAVCVCFVSATLWSQFGSVTFLVTQVYKCEDQGSEDFDGSLRLNRKNRTLVIMEGNLNLKVPVDSNFETTIMVYQWGNGGYKLIYTFREMNICTELAFLLGEGWVSLWTHAGLTAPIKCPIPKGSYELKDFDTQDFFKANVPAFNTGRFKLTQLFLRKKKLMGCINFVVEIQPKSLIGYKQ